MNDRMRPPLLGLIGLLIMLTALALAACGGAAEPAAKPAGDPVRGEQIFKTRDCVACHAITDQKLVGPGLKGVMDGKGAYAGKLPAGHPVRTSACRAKQAPHFTLP